MSNKVHVLKGIEKQYISPWGNCKVRVNNKMEKVEYSAYREELLTMLKSQGVEEVKSSIETKQIDDICFEEELLYLSCADNVFEYDIRVSSFARNESALVVPDEEFIPSIHSAKKVLDNSDAVLIAEFTLGYDEAKAYANRMKRKVKRVHWEKPAVIKVYARL